MELIPIPYGAFGRSIHPARRALGMAAVLVMAAAGTTLAASSSASASTVLCGPSTNPYVNCDGWSPTPSGCAADAITAWSKSVNGYTVELRYSPVCRAAWARISTNYPLGQEFWVYNEKNHEIEPMINEGVIVTGMVDDDGTLSHACMYAPAKECTPYY